MSGSPSAADEVSILIPAYMAEEFIDRTMLFARGQTYRNVRILVSIDVSTDATAAIVERHVAEDDRVSVVAHDERLGWAGNVKGAFIKWKRPQLDCLDEAANTATYLGLLERAGLLRLHVPRKTQQRPAHYAASMAERASGEVWVVDSWVWDNGEPPALQPLQAWLDGEEPVRPYGVEKRPYLT